MTSILALRAAGLGDLLTALPALRALRRIGEVTLAIPEWLAPISMWSGATDAIHPTERLNSPPPLGPFDIAVDLHGCGPESHRWLFRTSPSRLIAFRNDAVPESDSGPPWDDDEHEVMRWCRLLRHAGIPADPRDLRISAPPDPLPAHEGPRAIIHPGAKDAARRWPAERWTDVARWLGGRGHTVIITGSAGELPLASAIADAAGLPRDSVIAGDTDVLGLAGVMGGADIVLSGDTGAAHLAAALDRPSVAIYGPTSPTRWGPAPSRDRVVLWAGAEDDPHAGRPSAGLLAIGADEVLAAIADLDARRRAA